METKTSGQVAVLPMRAGKANAIGTAFLDQLSAQLDAVESSGASALVLTGEGTAFSAGLDLPEVSGLDRAQLERFICNFSEVMLRVFTLPMPVVAAINGHAIAGGCVLALQADVRLAAAGDYRIGLNEVQIGLGLPAVVLETLRAQVSPASLGPVALEGRLLAPEEARALGLVEAVVPPAVLLEQARGRAAGLAALASSCVPRREAGPARTRGRGGPRRRAGGRAEVGRDRVQPGRARAAGRGGPPSDAAALAAAAHHTRTRASGARYSAWPCSRRRRSTRDRSCGR
jgi:enoyl-CoA hydratase